MKLKQKAAYKIFSLISSFSLLINSFSPVISVALAEELTPTPEPTVNSEQITVDSEITPTDAPIQTPTPEATVVPTPTIIPTEGPTSPPAGGPTQEIKPNPEITTVNSEQPTVNSEQRTEDSIQPTVNSEQRTENNQQQTESSEVVPKETVTPSVKVKKEIHGHLEAVILDNVPVENSDNLTLDLDSNSYSSASISTDKPDYSPTDIVLITGTGFLAGETYTLLIISENNPPVYFETKVTADENGGFIYTYQLDGTYRPNYRVEARDKEGNVVAETSFADSLPAGSCPPDALFCDDFESENLNRWTSTGNSNTDDHYDVKRGCPGDFSACGDDNKNDYGRIGEGGFLQKNLLSTLGYTNLQLSYWRRGGSKFDASDKLTVSWRVGSSGSWNNLEDISPDIIWIKKTWSLPTGAENQTEIQVKFLSSANKDDEFVYLDDVLLTGTQYSPSPTPTLTPTNTPTPTSTPTPTPTSTPSPTPTPTPSGNWPRCDLKCTANDVSVTNLYLSNVNTQCTPGTNTSAELWARFHNNMNANRTCIWLVADIWVNGTLTHNDFVSLPISSIDGNGDKDIKLTGITWPCGSSVELKDLLIMWSPPGTKDCEANCGEANPAKCYQAATGPAVYAPLIANFEFTTVCFGSSTQFTDKTTGGKKPYTYAWDFNNDGNIESTSANPSYTYSAPGKYTAVLKVTDADNNQDTQEYEVEVRDCRGSITIIKDSNPDDVQDFSFTTTGTGLSNFSLDDDDDQTLPNIKTFDNLFAGNYSVTEGLIDGWTLSNIACVDPDQGTSIDIENRKANIDLDNEETVICTFTNTKLGKIIIEKQTTPNNDEETLFNFTSNYKDSFSLKNGETDDSGYLLPGEYIATESAKIGWDLTSLVCNEDKNPNSTTDINSYTAYISLEPGETVHCIFDNTKRGSISGYKWEDLDGDGSWDGAEPVIAGGVTVYIDLNGNREQDEGDISTYTDENGAYNFSNLLPGTYYVCERDDLLTGWERTYPSGSSCQEVEVVSGENITNINFGNFKLGKISGTKFEDLNGNGIKDEGEPGLNKWTIFIDENSDGILDGEEVSLITDDNGYYEFENLTAGAYRICEVITDGWRQTKPSEGCYLINIESGSEEKDKDFGNVTIQKPTIIISKSNNTTGSISLGAIVTYEIKVKNESDYAPLYKTFVSDTRPYKTTYQSNSTKATSNIHGVLTISEPTCDDYTCVFSLGTLEPGEEITLTYDLKIDNAPISGTYYNLAYAYGSDSPHSNRIESAIVESAIKIDKALSYSSDVKPGETIITSEVLGAATGPEGEILGAATGVKWQILVLEVLIILVGLYLRKRLLRLINPKS